MTNMIIIPLYREVIFQVATTCQLVVPCLLNSKAIVILKEVVGNTGDGPQDIPGFLTQQLYWARYKEFR